MKLSLIPGRIFAACKHRGHSDEAIGRMSPEELFTEFCRAEGVGASIGGDISLYRMALFLNDSSKLDQLEYFATVKLTSQQIADVMVTAFEGGINYWCSAARRISGPPTTEKPWYSDSAFWEGDFELRFEIGDDEVAVMTRQSLIEGIGKVPIDTISDVVGEMMDADTADVFIQYVLFGELVYS